MWGKPAESGPEIMEAGVEMGVVWDLQTQNPGVVLILFYWTPQNSEMGVDKHTWFLAQFFFNINLKGKSPLSKWAGSRNCGL